MQETLAARVEAWFGRGAEAVGSAEAMEAFAELRGSLERGEVRAAEPDASLPLGWRV